VKQPQQHRGLGSSGSTSFYLLVEDVETTAAIDLKHRIESLEFSGEIIITIFLRTTFVVCSPPLLLDLLLRSTCLSLSTLIVCGL
jgi:hypothetical protein